MAKILSINAKCNDCCSLEYYNEEDNTQSSKVDYVTRGLGIGGGDYIKLQIDIETGQIRNWKSLSEDDVLNLLSDEE